MSRLTIYADDDPRTADLDTTEFAAIREQLRGIDVRFERWHAARELPRAATDADVLAIYAADVERLQQQDGYQTVDVLRVNRDTPDKPAVRGKFLNEHTHSENEVRFFVEGAGVFYLRAAGKVYMMLCERGDLISVPAGTRHWFDMGADPQITAIRFFDNKEGWVPHFTGSSIAAVFPKFEPQTRQPRLTNIAAILTDIEGTTSSLSFVKDVLFPYARQHLADHVRNDAARLAPILDEVRALEGSPQMSTEQIIAVLIQWMATDRKITPLKTLQGMIWERGYLAGDFQGHIYQDALEALQRWQAMGLHLYVYSSGSVAAQKLLFAHTPQGDLTGLFSGYFDTTLGSKLEASSYQKIAAHLNLATDKILFLSDSAAELAAAAAAGLQVIRIDRSPQPEGDDSVASFQQIMLGP